jgi:hypothetical protein
MLLWLLACTEAPSNEGYLLTGWYYGWENLSHRIALLDVGLEQDEQTPWLDLGFIGGPYSSGAAGTDVPLYRVSYEKISSPDLWFAEGEVEMVIGPNASTQQGSAVGSIPDPGFGEVDGMIAVLRGFRIATDVEQGADYPLDVYDPAYGYTSKGFSVELGAPTLVGDNLEVPVEGTVRWAAQDRDDMNAAIPYAMTELVVRYTIVGYKGSLESQKIQGEKIYEVENPDAPMWSFTEQPPMTTSLELAGKGRTGPIAWTSFDFLVNETGSFAGEGDYMRAIGLEMRPTADARGEIEAAVTTTVQTSSLIELTELNAAFQANAVRIGVKDAVVEHFQVEGSHPVGEAENHQLP